MSGPDLKRTTQIGRVRHYGLDGTKKCPAAFGGLPGGWSRPNGKSQPNSAIIWNHAKPMILVGASVHRNAATSFATWQTAQHAISHTKLRLQHVIRLNRCSTTSGLIV